MAPRKSPAKPKAARKAPAKSTTSVVEKPVAPVRRKYICRRKCQPRCDDGKIRFFNPGDVFYFSNEAPAHFSPVNRLGLSEIDWSMVAENILRDENAVPLSYITTFMFETYGEQLEGFPRKAVVDKFIELRGLDTSTLSSGPHVVPTAAEFKNKEKEANLGVSFEKEEGVELSDGSDLELDAEDEDDLSDLLLDDKE